ncbi:hypothetical protein AAGS40_29565 (plasmid) [Paraburkholderia sp. PREW-6R]|uniref:hypothetical protein n=1 Tax=Paraburkholderia sp. PREW-6R TaxID=3141544 RepID=UPI0031F51465
MEIDDSKEFDNASIDICGALQAGKCPDFDAFWAYLKRTYSGDAGKRIGLVQAAKLIIDGSTFAPTPRSSGRPAPSCGKHESWSEPCHRSSARRPTYQSRQTVANITRGLGAFSGHAGFEVLASELKHGRLLDYQFETREKVCLSGPDIVMYNEK